MPRLAALILVALIAGCAPADPSLSAVLRVTATHADDAALAFGGTSWQARLTTATGSFEWQVDGQLVELEPGATRLEVWSVGHSDDIGCVVGPAGGEPVCHRDSWQGPRCSTAFIAEPGDQLAIEYRLLADERCELRPG